MLDHRKITAFTISLLVFVSCFSVFQLGSCYTGTITYNATTNKITCVGGNSSVPITFDDLYLADVAGGWNVFFKTVTSPSSFRSQYYSQAGIIIGNGSSTYFADYDCQILFTNDVTTASSTGLIQVSNNSIAKFGVEIDNTTKSSKSGVAFRSWETASSIRLIIGDSGSTVYMYSCLFTGNPNINTRIVLSGSSNRIWNCIFADYLAFGDSAGIDMYNVQLSSADYGFFRCSGTFNKIYVYNQGTAAFLASNSVAFNVSDAYVVNCAKLASVASAVNNYLVNTYCDNWTFTFSAAGTVYRQYQYDLIVLNGEITDFVENANVTLTKGSTQIGTWLTNSSGQIDTQILTYGFYNQTGGDTMYDGSDPFVLTVTHDDWATYTSRFYVTEKTKMTISMQEVPPSVTPDPSVYQTIEEGLNYTIIAVFFIAIVGVCIVILFFLRRND